MAQEQKKEQTKQCLDATLDVELLPELREIVMEFTSFD